MIFWGKKEKQSHQQSHQRSNSLSDFFQDELGEGWEVSVYRLFERNIKRYDVRFYGKTVAYLQKMGEGYSIRGCPNKKLEDMIMGRFDFAAQKYQAFQNPKNKKQGSAEEWTLQDAIESLERHGAGIGDQTP